METLIPMTDYVIKQNSTDGKPLFSTDWAKEFEIKFKKCARYAELLKEPLNISMFVPSVFENGEWIVLDMPSAWDFMSPATQKKAELNAKKYKEAKSKCYFEGCSIEKIKDYYLVKSPCVLGLWASWNESKIIETLLWANLPLTETLKNRLK